MDTNQTEQLETGTKLIFFTDREKNTDYHFCKSESCELAVYKNGTKFQPRSKRIGMPNVYATYGQLPFKEMPKWWIGT